jgi:hypothetical protein
MLSNQLLAAGNMGTIIPEKNSKPVNEYTHMLSTLPPLPVQTLLKKKKLYCNYSPAKR